MTMKNPPHPARTIKGAMEELNLTTAQAAEAMDVARSTLHRLLSEESKITAEMAIRLEAVIGSSADHWLRRQAAYDLAQVRNSANNPAQGLKRVVAPDGLPSHPSA